VAVADASSKAEKILWKAKFELISKHSSVDLEQTTEEFSNAGVAVFKLTTN
jgi:hypothetical protein